MNEFDQKIIQLAATYAEPQGFIDLLEGKLSQVTAKEKAKVFLAMVHQVGTSKNKIHWGSSDICAHRVSADIVVMSTMAFRNLVYGTTSFERKRTF